MALEVDITQKAGRNFLCICSSGRSGRLFAILGASGCGKSMTLKCIAGIEKPDEGRIVLDGKVLFDSEQKNQSAAAEAESRLYVPGLRSVSAYECCAEY